MVTYIHLQQSKVTGLLLSHHEGKRSTEDAIELFKEVELSQYKGIEKNPLPKLVPLDDLKYIKVLKKKVKNYVVETVQRIIFGDPEEIFEMLGVDSDSYIGTSYAERINLTIRTSLARFIRKGMNFSKNLRMHQKALDLFQAWYNFIKPHKFLRLKIESGNRKWFQRTPPMAEGIINHI